MGAVHLLNCLFWHKVTTQARILYFTSVSQLNSLFLVFSQLEGKQVSVILWSHFFNLCVFTWKALTASCARKLAMMCHFRALEWLRIWDLPCPVGSQKPGPMSFPGMAFTSCTNTYLKYAVWAKTPLLPFPLLKVLLAHRVIFSFWLENWWGLLRGSGNSPVFSFGETYILLLGYFFHFPSQSERGPGMFICSQLCLACVCEQ